MNDSESKEEVRKHKMLEFSTHLGALFGVAGLTSTILTNTAPTLALLPNLGISFLCGATALVGFIFWLALAHRDNTYHLVARDKGGSVLIDHVRNAKQSIVGTHFTKEPPSNAYLAMLQEVLSSGVTMRRLIYFHGDPCGKDYEWLSAFEGNPTYEQIAVNSALPFNVVIIDQQTVWLFFPLRSAPFFRNAIWFKDKDVADLFEAMFAYWERTHVIEGHRRNYQMAESVAFGMESPKRIDTTDAPSPDSNDRSASQGARSGRESGKRENS